LNIFLPNEPGGIRDFLLYSTIIHKMLKRNLCNEKNLSRKFSINIRKGRKTRELEREHSRKRSKKHKK
jgi:hypothetical protein